MAKKLSAAALSNGKTIAKELARLSDELVRLAEANQRIEDLVTLMAQPMLLPALHALFKDAKQLRAYQLSDGRRSTREIGKSVGVDQKTISRWWRAWKDYKIMEKAGKRGQFRARYSLGALVAMQPAMSDEAATVPANETAEEQAPLF
ncbi:MAG: hypothetical protein ABI847_15260 [Anaerolineales bacterium]